MNACTESHAGPPCPTLTLVDSSIFVFRAWFARGLDPDPLGRPGGAVHGLVHSLCQWLPACAPGPIAFCFDESLRQGFRHRLDPTYKAHRPPAPPELREQFARIRELLGQLGFRTLAHPEYEADDLIASLARAGRAAGFRIEVKSADKDLTQVILGDQDRLHDPERGTALDRRAIEKRFRIRPEQVADMLALAGDASDNIPGIEGVGPRTAARILRRLGDLETVLADPQAVARCTIRRADAVAARIAGQSDRLCLSRRLTGLVDRIPDLPRLETLHPTGPKPDAARWLAELGVARDYHGCLLAAAGAWRSTTPEIA
ncbi:5'-3' exonuclease, N-terminal resolvase-like domain protein [Thioalkalivibrio sp. K90mix]|uniref:5'-3' exonuclease n=1 Tax=Thioalkalivibrio sp. (strain K90mix) TaxID=396595 RepID=UPI0001959661|nr:5'-3' exonuclease H3TH domain-containing protein [Thioalkalivibrio sp. K90mix]ADC72866.1 5'-3' exonuclease, N-terminal resolvase-like domain protein [Thioalkalivibrio sp. K90mix]